VTTLEQIHSSPKDYPMTKSKEVKPDLTAVPNAQSPKLLWDDSDMATAYANVCNVTSTREEFTLLFGTNQLLLTDQEPVKVKLSDRIILNPFVAKRLNLLLSHVVRQHEEKFGKLDKANG
jgi:hypothetical protein